MRSGVPTRLVDDRRPADTLQRRCEQIVLPSEGARPNPPLGGVVVQAGSAIASTAVSVVHCGRAADPGLQIQEFVPPPFAPNAQNFTSMQFHTGTARLPGCFYKVFCLRLIDRRLKN